MKQRVHLDFFLFFFTVEGTSQQRPDKGCALILFIFIIEGEGGGGMEFFFMVPSLEMWKEEGGKGLIGFCGNCLIFFLL